MHKYEHSPDSEQNQLATEKFNVMGRNCEVLLLNDVPVAIKVGDKQYYLGDHVHFKKTQLGGGFGHLIKINMDLLRKGDTMPLEVINDKGNQEPLKIHELNSNLTTLIDRARGEIIANDTKDKVKKAADL
jgi:hypothetical protein